eukprot:GHVT01032688.1.p1 GENE.GHVT01032688.1~~GHVT01032688.1.p1  ORF type:complete len:164 (-),score=0.38 GHVT01032688.1:560-1051(-)
MRPAASGAGTQSKGAKGKLRILCLPGWRTSKTIMEIQMDIAGLRKTCNSMATFIAVNPSYEAQPDPPDAIKALDPQGPYYQWWYIDEARSNYECVYQGMNGTIDKYCRKSRCEYTKVTYTLRIQKANLGVANKHLPVERCKTRTKLPSIVDCHRRNRKPTSRF